MGTRARLGGKLVVVKIGGSAITDKNGVEALKHDELDAVAKQIQAAHLDGVKLCIVHGAGSFGHSQARKHNTKRGFKKDMSAGAEEESDGTLGFCDVRRSVTLLNHMVVTALVSQGIPAVAMHPFPAWECSSGQLFDKDGMKNVGRAMEAGFVPVLHGDAVLDTNLGCTILGGDEILLRLAEELEPVSAVFVTDVAGVYTGPPHEEGSVLIPEIRVNASNGSVSMPRTSHDPEKDVTGGMKNKVESAAKIAFRARVPVHIVRAGGPDASEALHGQTPSGGTVIRVGQ